MGSVVKTKLDQLVVDTIFSDHINSQVLQGQVRAAGDVPSSPATSFSAHCTVHNSEQREAEKERVEGEESLACQPTLIFLHSLPAGDLTFDLTWPPNKAIGQYTHDRRKEEKKSFINILCAGISVETYLVF